MTVPALSDQLPAVIESSALSGQHGSNRSTSGVRQISADTDLEAVQLWLAEYATSSHTLKSYRKEAVRLLLWSTQRIGKPLSSLTREDLLAYEAFLRAPSQDWIDPTLPRHGGQRRLMEGPLSASSVRQAMGILSGLFHYLVEAGYLAGNPLALRRRSRGEAQAQRRVAIERYLDHALWQQMLTFIESMPKNTSREQQHYERVRWVFRLLYESALRISEVASATTKDLIQRRGRWWLRVIGKGGVQGDVPISDQLMADFERYCKFHGLPVVWSGHRAMPLVLSVAGRAELALTPTAIYLVVKQTFRQAADAIGESNPSGADTLRRASPHWLRHTAATHQADAGTDIRYIQKNLRHASIETTAIYLHAEDDARHSTSTGTAIKNAGLN